MDKKAIMMMKKSFDDIMHTTEGGSVEFWYARELMECLEYATWRRFKDTIERAQESCESAGIEVSDHFAGAGKMVEIGSGAMREKEDLMLTRYACYLIAQNGDPRKLEGFFEYVVPPLEGFWWQEGVDGIDYADKSTFNWISVIRLPDFITEKDFNWAVETATKKKKLDCSSAEFLTIDQGLCLHIMHLEEFDYEPATVALTDKFLDENGYVNDITDTRLHHEIYMSDARKVAPEWSSEIR